MRLYAANPEKASKLMEGHLKMQTGKLEQAEKMNEQMYQVLSAVEASPESRGDVSARPWNPSENGVFLFQPPSPSSTIPH